jgi:hypothetical protein
MPLFSTFLLFCLCVRLSVPSQLQGRNVVVKKQNCEGVFVLSNSWNFRDEARSNFWGIEYPGFFLLEVA